MADCSGVCAQERTGAAVYRSELVRDEEWVCRTVRPAEYKAKNRLKASFVQTSRLAAGELSAWRVDDPVDLPTLGAKLTEMKLAPDNIIAVRAESLRRIAVQGSSRGLSVVGDTRVDEHGNHDPQHVVLAPCAQLAADEGSISELKAQILLVYRSSRAEALRVVPDS